MSFTTIPRTPGLGQMMGQGFNQGVEQQLPQIMQFLDQQRQSKGMSDVMGQLNEDMSPEQKLQAVYQQQGLNPTSQSQLVSLISNMPGMKREEIKWKQSQDKQFREYALDQLQGKTPEQQQRFLRASKDFKDVVDPAERYRKSEEVYRERERIRGTLETTQQRPNWFKRFFADAETKTIGEGQVIAKRALENKIPVEEIEAQFATKGHTPIEVEAIVHPLSKSTEMKVKQLGAELSRITKGTGIFSSPKTEAKLTSGLRNLIKEDTSLLMVSDMLKKKGIPEKTISKVLQEMAVSGFKFTEKQVQDFAKIGQGVENKAQSISDIFGG